MNEYRNDTATVWQALRSWPYTKLYMMAFRRMGATKIKRWRLQLRFYIVWKSGHAVTFWNFVLLWSAPRCRAWQSRYPRWAPEYGGSCGCRCTDGYRCQISGMSHAGPHRSDGRLERQRYEVYGSRSA